MNNNESRTLWMSLGAGLFAAFLLYSYSQEKKAEYDKSYGAMVNVVTAKKDIQELQTIDDDMIEISQKPANFAEPGTVNDTESIIGHVAAAPIKKGEQILANKLLQPGPETGISLQVSPTKRALSLPVDEVRAVAKLIRPGDRVDIVVAVDNGKGVAARREVKTLLYDIPVLATGVSVVNNIPRTFDVDANSKSIMQTSLIGDTKYSSVTVEVSPREAQDLIYILSTSPGNIFLTLRNPNDKQVPPRLMTTTSESLVGGTSIEATNFQSAPIVSPQMQAPRFPANNRNSVGRPR